MHNVPPWTYILDALGVFGIIVGGYVASKSVYSRENSKDAALLIDTQRKRIDSLIEEIKTERGERTQLQAKVSEMQGELNTYKDLQLVKPDVIEKLVETQDAILKFIKDKA